MASVASVFVQRRSVATTIAAVVGIAFVLRIAWLWYLGPTEITWDGAEYATAAENLRNGLGYLGIRGSTLLVFPPFYSFAIALAMFFTSNSWAAAIAVSIVAGCAFAPLAFACADRLYGRQTAIYAGVIVACLPFAIDISDVALSDAFFLTLAAAGVWRTLCLVEDGRWSDGALAGLAFGLAYLTRPEGLVLGAAAFAATGAALALSAVRRRGILAGMGALALTLALVALPYVVFLSLNLHSVRLEGKSDVNLSIAQRMASGMGYVQAADAVDERGNQVGAELDATYAYATNPASLRDRLGVLAAGARRHIVDIPRTLISRPYGSVVLFLLAVFGLASGPWTRARVRRELVIVAYCAALFASLASVYHFWPRYADGFILPLALWGAHGLERMRTAIAARRGAQRGVPANVFAVAMAVLLIGCTVATRASFRDNVNDSSDVMERTVGEWLARSVPPGPRLLSVSDQSVYYAHGRWIQAPWAPDADAALRYVRRTHPDYVELSAVPDPDRPYASVWANHGIDAQHRQPLHIFRDELGRPLVVVYRWSVR